MLARLLVRMALVVAVAAPPAAAAPWAQVGPDGGDIRRIVVDPLTPTTLYAGTNRSLFKSTDGGTSWTALPSLGLAYCLAIDPLAPTTLYAGITTGTASTTPGLYKSTDAGTSWVRLPAAPFVVRSLGVDPTTPGRLYVGEHGGRVWRSLDGGGTWAVTALSPGFSVETLAVDPVNAGVVYAATFEIGSAGDRVYKSTNGGVTFAPTTLAAQDVSFIAVDPVDPQVVYAAPYGFSGTKLWKSTDAGATWNPSDAGLSAPLNVIEAPIVVDPLTHTTVYVGTLTGVFRSVDGGATWTAASTGLVSPRVNALVIHPTTPTTLWVGTYGGEVAKSTDGGATWGSSSGGMRESSVVTVAVDPTDSAVLYAGSEWNGIHKSVDGGATWTAANTGLPSGEIRQLRVDPTVPTTVYAVAGLFGGKVVRSLDGGASWTDSSSGLPVDPDVQLTALVLDPSTPGRLYAGSNADYHGLGPSLHRSLDGGASWSPTAAAVYQRVQAIAVAPSSGRVYAADSASALHVSDDGGSAWTTAGTVPGFALSLAVHPADPATVLAGTESGIRRSTDGGASWGPAKLGARMVAAVAIDPSQPLNAYAATDSGVFASLDGGVTWTEVSSGLAETNVATIAVDPAVAARVFAGVYEDGLYRRDLGTCATDADCDDESLCTTGDACIPTDSASNAFGCVQTPVVCPPPGECQLGAGTCDRHRGCQYGSRPFNSPCSSDGTDCTSDLCQAGVCVHAPAPLPACHEPIVPAASVLAFRNARPDRARLLWRWAKGATAAADLGDPFTPGASDYELCLYDRSGVAGGERLVASMRAPAGGTCAGFGCWILGGRGAKYKDRERTPDGLDTLQLTFGAVDQARVRAAAKGLNLDLPDVPVAPPLRAQLRRDDAPGVCWQASFATGIEKNLPGDFKAKSD